MQLGHCKFDIDKGELINQESGLVWHLPRAELHVLTLLVEYQGKVVAKPLLESGHEDDSHFSSASVARAIFTLRSFLGPQYEILIETVKGQGYLLRHHRARKEIDVKRGRFIIRPLHALLVVIALVGVLLSLWWFSQIGYSISPTMPLSMKTVSLDSGQQVEVILYSPSNTNNELLIDQGQQLTQSLLGCTDTVWDRVFLSLSHDKQVLNITFRGDYFGQSIIRNLKISDLRQPKRFINPEWLEQVNICDSLPVRLASSHRTQGR
ncbi:winged helix-turn-helix domain-containing protein [Shewanella livingstonensis]|uniref:Helix-turn-helix domain-containing protein n=1 Tax=Shewanella livingstonensis TaxID=150120 RepID=A0A3G8LYU4_9GAMM|nr:helix-turn-helix domain-containing protein [Shewanella livingstonensis]AZG74856.1 helix-turn-helix domain-containing protein [Shewanella livingstonensis]